MKICCKCKLREDQIDFGANRSICKSCLRNRWMEKYGKTCPICDVKFCRKGTLFCSSRCTIQGKSEKNENGCWIWKGAKSGDGYGAIKEINSRKQVGVHRKSYEEYKGEIAGGLYVCHVCDNPLCCNPEHLFLGNHSDNMRDSVKKGRSRCSKQNGSKNHYSKLNENIVRMIRELYKKGNMVTSIHHITHIPMKTLESIVYNVTWNHVKVEN